MSANIFHGSNVAGVRLYKSMDLFPMEEQKSMDKNSTVKFHGFAERTLGWSNWRKPVNSPTEGNSQYQLFQDDISRLSISNSTKIFKGAKYNLSIHAYKFCSHRSLRCRPALGRRRTPFKLGLVQRSTASGRRSWETSKLSYRRPILGVQKKILAFKNVSFERKSTTPAEDEYCEKWPSRRCFEKWLKTITSRTNYWWNILYDHSELNISFSLKRSSSSSSLPSSSMASAGDVA